MTNPWQESFEELRASMEALHEEQESQDANIAKKARQLAYDIRYEVKKSFGKDGNLNSAAIKRAYLQKLAKSPASGPVKLKAKQMLVGVKEDFEFVEEEVKKKKDLYKVTDAETKHSYVRKADSKKVEELRRNPKIASVERTQSGEPYEGKKPKRWWDDDGDGKGYEPGEVKGSFKKKVKKESFSNWRDEIGENFFFRSLNEKVSPSSPYCDVMPDQKTSGKETDAEKKRQNKMLTRKEDFQPLADELGAELLEFQTPKVPVRTPVRSAVKPSPRVVARTAAKQPQPKTPPGAQTFRSLVDIGRSALSIAKSPIIGTSAAVFTPTPTASAKYDELKNNPYVTPTRHIPRPTPTRVPVKPQPAPSPTPKTPPHPEPSPAPVPHRPGKPTKPRTPTKPGKKPGTPTKPGTKPGSLVIPSQKTGPLTVPSNKSKPNLNPVPTNLPSPTISGGPGGKPGKEFNLRIPKFPKGKELGREIGFVSTKQINK